MQNRASCVLPRFFRAVLFCLLVITIFLLLSSPIELLDENEKTTE